MRHQTKLYKISGNLLLMAAVLALVLSGCGGSMSDDEKEIAVAVALTQTAAALDTDGVAAGAEDASSAVSTPTPTVANGGDVEQPPATLPPTEAEVVPSATPIPDAASNAGAATPAATTGAVTAAGGESDTMVDQLTIDPFPVTQNNLKVRSLLVAPGEPGALYALLTDAAVASEPATGARLLVSRNFGATWESAASGLPVADDCLFTINMDYYGATALYASTCQGIYRWAEGNETWAVVSPEVTAMVAVVYGNDNLLWATRPVGAEGAPIIVSQNGGESWRPIEIANDGGIANLGISPRNSQNAYAIVWPGAAGNSAGSYLRRGSMLSAWETVPTPANNSAINTGMTIDGGTGWLYVTTTETDGDRLWLSTDADTVLVEDVGWREVHQFAAGATVELLASGWSSAADELAIYANISTTVNGQTRFALVRSLDSGRTWAPLVVDAG